MTNNCIRLVYMLKLFYSLIYKIIFMSEIVNDIDNNWYCANCLVNYNCLNCDVMNQLVESRYMLINILEDKKIQNNDININKTLDYPICWTCGKVMKKSKRKKWAKYWCTCRH